MAELADGELMARAAEGLADVCRARLTERPAAAASWSSRRRATTAPMPCMPRRTSPSERLRLRCAAGRLAVGHRRCRVVAGRRASRVVAPDGDWAAALAEADLVVDGVLGIGGRPGLPDEAVGLGRRDPRRGLRRQRRPARRARTRPGEACRTTGVFADETVTFGVAKPVHLLPATEAAVGRLTVIDIGLDAWTVRLTSSGSTSPTWPALWPVPGAGDDKYSRGVLGVVAGGEDYTGRRGAVLHGRGRGRAGHAPLRRHPDADRPACGRPSPRRCTVTGRVQAWVVGPGLDVALPGAGRQGPARRRPRRPRLRPARARRRRRARPRRRAAAAARPCSPPTPASWPGCSPGSSRRRDRVAPGRCEADPLGARAPGRRPAPARRPAQGRDHPRRAAHRRRACPVRSQNDAPPWLATAGAGDVLAGVCGALLAAGLVPARRRQPRRPRARRGRGPGQPGRARSARSPWPTAYPAPWPTCSLADLGGRERLDGDE